MRKARLLFLLLAIPTASSFVQAQPAVSNDLQIRTLYFQRDYERAAMLGREKLAASPDAPVEVRAWYVLSLARSGQADDAVTMARQMRTEFSQDPWSWFALAGALQYKGGQTSDAIDAAVKAFELSPAHRDFIWIRALTLAGDAKQRTEAMAFVDAQRSKVKNPAEVLVTRAHALYNMSNGTPRDEAKIEASLAGFEEVRRLDPSNVNAHYLPGTYLTQMKRADEGYALLKKAVTLAPGASEVRRAYWNAIKARPDLTADAKRAEIEADVDVFLQQHGNRPGALRTVSSVAREMKFDDKVKLAEDRILKDFDDTLEAEWVLVDRWRAIDESDPERKSKRRQMYRDYLARPRHYHEGLRGEAYRELFHLLSEDQSAAGDELYEAVQGMVKYETINPHTVYGRAPLALADRKTHLADAERIAREGIEVLRKKVAGRRSLYDTPGDYERALESAAAIGHDALGWVLFAQGRMDEAEKDLRRSYELDHDSRENLHHLGRFYEAKNDLSRAEEYYIKGLSIQRPGTNPSEAALKSLYAKRHGSDAGFDEYVGKLRDADREKRREKIIADRVTPSPPPAFSLKTLSGDRVSLESLKGKIVVINFWGIWCGWCVKEMPDFQKLHEKYRADPDVAVLTIDNDDDPSEVPPWMKQKGYTFSVLLDDGYVADKAAVRAFPTTWFLDRAGRKVFVKVGWSEKLLEEFSWRIEAIRAETGSR